MHSAVAIHALGEKLCPDEAVFLNGDFMQNLKYGRSLLYEVPGGNQVDGLPPAASNATRKNAGRSEANIFVAKPGFKFNIHEMYLSELNKDSK